MNQLSKRLKDYAKANPDLFLQRQATLVGGTVLATYYVDVSTALICCALCLFAQVYDYRICRDILNWNGQGDDIAEYHQKRAIKGAFFGAMSVSIYIVLIAFAEGPVLHMGPLFFLFASVLYSAMYSSQLPRLLIIQLATYSVAALIIPLYDLWMVMPPLSSDLWKQLGIVIFVQYFLFECTVQFQARYETNLKQLEELRIERDRVAKAYNLQSEFVSIVSHELRTPLTSIKASLDLVSATSESTLPARISDVVHVGRRSCHRLSKLIDDLLDLQILKTGKMAYQFLPVDMVSITHEARETCLPLATRKSQDLIVHTPDAPVKVTGDANRLLQVLVNILSNAIKFSDEKGQIITSLRHSGGTLFLSVADNGAGIPENSEQDVFRPFTQLDGSDKREHGGSGLGLSIAKRILEDHGGRIYYQSTRGQGTTFTIELEIIRDSAVPSAPNMDQFLGPRDPHQPDPLAHAHLPAAE